MVLPVIVIPLWGKIVAISVAKKITVLLAARLYGFPRLYRKSQKTVRWLFKDPARRDWWGGYVRAVWRIPDKILYRWHNKAVKAAGVPEAALPKTPLGADLRTRLSVDRLFAGSNTLAARTEVSAAEQGRAAVARAQGPTFASAPVLRQHHRELQEHRRLLEDSRSLASRYSQLRNIGRQQLQGLQGRMRNKMEEVALFARKRDVSKRMLHRDPS